MGRIRVGQSFKVSCYCRSRLSVRDTSIGGTQQDWESLFAKGVSTRRPQISGRVHYLCAVHRSCPFQSWTGTKLFLPVIIIGGDDHAPLHLLGLLLDGLLERGWMKGSEIEACRAEYQTFVPEQRQLERSSTRSRPDIGDVLSFCSSQASFRARQHPFKVCIVAKSSKPGEFLSQK